MNFLKAAQLVREFRGGPSFPFLLALSGTADSLTLYLRAVGATRGVTVEPRYLPFGTLQQALMEPVRSDQREVFLLMPWDIVPELDFRSGVSTQHPLDQEIRSRAERTMDRLSSRGAKLIYIPAICAPLWLQPSKNEGLDLWIRAELRSRGAAFLEPEAFSLSSYLSAGNPFASSHLASVATVVLNSATETPVPSAKVLVTDLDQTVWSGIVGDDGVEGLAFRPEGLGYPHFLYQCLLLRLKNEGVLLAAVSKNDEATALLPFETGQMVLRGSDFVAIRASWNAKSAQIASLAEQLNLGLEAFVFVDDNPVELAEVAAELPAVRSLLFPKSARELPELLARLVELFQRTTVSAEDRDRTALYRRRLEGLPPSDSAGGDISDFLRDLAMSLTVTDRTASDRSRAIQLLNKTNQFNLNGRRLLEVDVIRQLETGSRIYACTLEDRTGSHGEILCAIVSADGIITSMVMSCRIFQRRVEHAFLAWLAIQRPGRLAVEYARTDRNTPTTDFLRSILGRDPEDGLIELPVGALIERYAADLAFFTFSTG
jgi:FkbH-like protein